MDNSIKVRDTQAGPLDDSMFKALDNLRMFSIMAMVVFLLSIIGSLFIISSFIILINQVSTGTAEIHAGNNISSAGFSISIISIALELISFLFLRAALKILKGRSWKFESSYTGTNLYFSGFLVLLVGIVLILSTVKLASVYTLWAGFLLIIVGGVTGLAGEVMGLILGSLRLKDYFQESGFEKAAIMYIIGIFISLFSLIGAIFMYKAVNNVINRLKAVQVNVPS